jgi:hypothetical protein
MGMKGWTTRGWTVGALAFTASVAALPGCDLADQFLCDTMMLDRQPSPSGRHIATTYERTCSATKPPDLRVVIQTPGEELDYARQEVLSTDERDLLLVDWVSDAELRIFTGRARENYQHRPMLRGVKVNVVQADPDTLGALAR